MPIHKIYSYVVKKDTGVAPNVDGGICTLALCKPVIRRCAQDADWVVGLWPVSKRSKSDRLCITYAMEVGQILPLARYWGDARFGYKKPRESSTPDNIYRPDRNGKLERVCTWVHPSPGDQERDLDGINVLVAKQFWYFGCVPKKLPQEFHCLDLKGSRRNHKITVWDDPRMKGFIKWLGKPGIIGGPRDGRPPKGGRCT
jgi:hypothetical protein